MRLLSLVRAGVWAALACVVAGLACGSSRDTAFSLDDAGASADAGEVSHPEAGNLVGDGSDTGAPTCSGDLRQVLEPGGVVLQTCPADQGCANGTCVAACTAAATAKGSLGCDFLVPTPKPHEGASEFSGGEDQPCYVVFVNNGWVADARINVSLGGTTYDATQFGRIAETGMPETAWPPVPSTGVPPGKVAVLFLSDDPTPQPNGSIPYECPVAPALRAEYGSLIPPTPSNTSPSGEVPGAQPTVTGRGQAWHIKTSLPVTSVDLMPYLPGGESLGPHYIPSASLLWPVTAWGTNYIALAPDAHACPMCDLSQMGVLVGSQDATTVTVRATQPMPSSPSVQAANPGVVTSFDLNAGEYIQWENGMGVQGELDTIDWSGTALLSNHPIAFIGGATLWSAATATYPSPSTGASHTQLFPVSALGNEYAVAPYASREASLADESVLYRILSVVDGTTLTFDPPASGAPSTLAAGQVADLEVTGSFVVSSQDQKHPFMIAQFMAGIDYWSTPMPWPAPRPACSPSEISAWFSGAGMQCGAGGADFVGVVPPPEFLTHYVFFAVPGYPTANIVVVRRDVGQGFQDVVLDCAGALGGWKPVGSSGKYEQTNIDLVRGTVPNGNCNNGPHTITSQAPFGVTVWGLDVMAAYAYPAGANFATINPVIVDPNQ